MIGPGLVGATLLDQLAAQQEQLRQRYTLDLRVLAIASSSRLLLSDTGVLPLEMPVSCSRDAFPLRLQVQKRA